MNILNNTDISTIKQAITEDFKSCEFVRCPSPLFAVIGWLDFADAGISSVLEHQGIFDLLWSICNDYNLELQWIYDAPEQNDFQGVNFMFEYKT